jgi:type IV pilus assembly protein PilE
MLPSPVNQAWPERIDRRHADPGTRCRRLGFTLIELLVVVAIVSILAAIAYPSYRSQVEKTRRADAQAALMQAAQFMERLYTENGCYDKSPCTTGTATALPFTKSPIDGNETYYNISLTAAATSFTITAKPLSPTETEKGKLDIDNTGIRHWDCNKSGAFNDGENTWGSSCPQ